MAAFLHHAEYLNGVYSFCPCDLSAAEEYISLCTPKSPSQFEHQVSSLRTSHKKAEKFPFGIRRRGRWCQHWRGRLKGIRERWRKMARWRKRKSFQPSVQSMSFLTVVHQKSAMEKARRFHLQCSFAYLHSHAYWLGLIHKWLHVRLWSLRKNARMQMLRITETDRNLVIRSSNYFFSSVLCECASTSIVSVNTFPHRLIDFVTTPVLTVSLRWGSPLFLAFLRF